MSKLTTCKTCSKEVAKSAKSCPNCGAKLKMGFFKKIGIGFGIIIVLFIIIGSIGSKNSSTTTSSDKKTTASNENNNTKKETKSETPTWNTKETDIEKNGNVQVAVKQLESAGDIKQKAEALEPSAVAKTPWNHYGKIVKMTGTIVDIAEYPIGSDWSKSLGGKEAGQIVISTNDGTIVDMFLVGSTGSLKNNQTVTLYGYPVGLSDVENKLGGKTTQLMIVGNAFDKQK